MLPMWKLHMYSLTYNILIVRMRVFAVLKLKGKTSGGQAVTGL
jgi:hypothetical protein